MDNQKEREQKILEDSVEDSQKRGHEYNNKLNEGYKRPPAPGRNFYFNIDTWQWVNRNPNPNPNHEKYEIEIY